jgi:uncharacterized alpha-E superfamily protein
MLSRTASCIYWMSRYLERADNVARFINVNSHLILDMGWEQEDTQWEPIILTTGDNDDYINRYQDYSEKNVMRFLIFDQDNPNSIFSCIASTRENARTVREIIPSEIWENINILYHSVIQHSRKRKVENLQEFLKNIHHYNQLILGLIENVMSHGEDWHFARIGRLLERADKTARMLDVKYFLLLPKREFIDSPYDTIEWGAVLKSVSGFEMYNKQCHRVNYKDVTQFLIFDQIFPRSIHFCVNKAAQSLTHITNMLEIDNRALQEMAKLQASIDSANITMILKNGLHEFIDVFQYNLNVVDNVLYQLFFALEKIDVIRIQCHS